MNDFSSQYAEILRHYLEHPSEELLFKAFALGKDSSRQEINISELIATHFQLLESYKGKYDDSVLSSSQNLLLETSMAMCLGGNLTTMKPVLAALYDETINQFYKLQEAKRKLVDYSRKLEKKVQEKLYELQRAEERFTILVRTIPDIVYKIDTHGRFLFLNDAVSSLGYTPEELKGKHFSEIIFPADVDNVSSASVLPRYAGKRTGDEDSPGLFDERRTGERKTSCLEVRILLKSGGTIDGVIERLGRECVYVEVSSSGVYLQNPETREAEHVGTVGVIRNISARKQTEKKLNRYQHHLEDIVAERTMELKEANAALQNEICERQKSEQSLKNILESMGEGLVKVDRDFNIQLVNSSFARQQGCSIEDACNSKCYRLSYNLDAPCYTQGRDCPVHNVFATGKPSFAVHEHVNTHGEQYRIELKGYPVTDHTGKVVAAIEIINDITEKEKLEEQLRQSQKMEAIGTLAGGIAHDFNNMLVPIIGYTELLLREEPETSGKREEMQEILKASKRAKDLVQQILTFSRHKKHERHPMPLTPLIKEVVKLLRSTLPANIEIKQDLQAPFDIIDADPTEIHQVIMNICTNAFHAMQKQGGVLKISGSNTSSEKSIHEHNVIIEGREYISLSISDTGDGIPPEILQKIYDPYFTTKEKGKGTGLGLTIVHTIITDLGGKISVESHAGKGTTFKIVLPIHADASREENDGVASPPLPRGHEHVMVVDDDQGVLNLLSRYLRGLGYRVKTISSSTEALTTFMSAPEQFDLIITDLTMPKMTGDRLVKKIRETDKKIPIILCTGYSNIVDDNQAEALGIQEFLFKPVVIEELAGTVRRLLDERTNTDA